MIYIRVENFINLEAIMKKLQVLFLKKTHKQCHYFKCFYCFNKKQYNNKMCLLLRFAYVCKNLTDLEAMIKN